jgi:hypothetical protein
LDAAVFAPDPQFGAASLGDVEVAVHDFPAALAGGTVAPLLTR